MKRTILSLWIFAAVLLTSSCQQTEQQTTASSSDEVSAAEQNTPLGQASVQDDVSDKNILQVAIGSKDHSTLVAAVQAANIEHVLVNAGPLTVFAPVNSAFEALPEGTLDDLLKPENKATLANILTGHAAPGSYDQASLTKEASKGRKLYMANGAYLDVVVDGEEITVGGAKVLGTVQTSNGVVNVVDQVILTE